ncbi:MAG: histidine kinase, partial [Oscillibacter sp.]
MDEKRPDPHVLLRTLAEETDGRGRLKIFFGYAAGVGKTFAMLSAAHEAKRAGIDVVCGYIEPHTRPETMALVEGLAVLPTQSVSYKNVTLKELDLDGALARHPQLLLVDELAHTNSAGCRHRKRYQDIEELLTAGIDVYTTVNVQHIESLNDSVASITGITVRERVPDSVFDKASQVEVVDIEPSDLILRLNQGKIYREQQAQQALDHFFTKEHLAALREIALRRTADRLNRDKRIPAQPGAHTEEHILICLSSSPSNPKVVRAGARLAEAFHGRFTALFVETPDTKELSEENRKRLRENLRLAEQLGAQIATVYGDDVSAQIARYAEISAVSKIILGRSNNKKR